MSEKPKIKSLWGELLQEAVRTPYVILKEQASILTEATNGLLIGSVSKTSAKEDKTDEFECELKINVPSMNNYSVSIAFLRYPIVLYPLRVYSRVEIPNKSSLSTKCNDEKELDKALEEILSSIEVRRMVAGLLNEVRIDQAEQKARGAF